MFQGCLQEIPSLLLYDYLWVLRVFEGYIDGGSKWLKILAGRDCESSYLRVLVYCYVRIAI